MVDEIKARHTVCAPNLAIVNFRHDSGKSSSLPSIRSRWNISVWSNWIIYLVVLLYRYSIFNNNLQKSAPHFFFGLMDTSDNTIRSELARIRRTRQLRVRWTPHVQNWDYVIRHLSHHALASVSCRYCLGDPMQWCERCLKMGGVLCHYGGATREPSLTSVGTQELACAYSSTADTFFLVWSGYQSYTA